MKLFTLLAILFSITAHAGNETGLPDQILRVPHAGGRVQAGSIDLSKSAAVGTSVAGIVNGGTNASTQSQAAINILPAASTVGQTVKWNGSAWVLGVALQNFAPIVETFTAEGAAAIGTLSTSSPCISSLTISSGTVNPGAGIIDSTHSAALPTGIFVVAMPGTCSSGQIQMSANASLAETGDSLVIGSEPITTGTISNSSVCITSVGTSAGIVPGVPVVDLTNPTAITFGTVVVAMPGTCSASQIQLSANAAISETGDSLQFGSVFTPPVSPVPLDLEVDAIAGGGGAPGGGNGGSGCGTAGGLTSFGLTTLAPGAGGCSAPSNPGAGGSISSSSLGADVTYGQLFPGGAGAPASGSGNGNAAASGGNGCNSIFGGGGAGGFGSNAYGSFNAIAAAADTGSGGGGGSGTASNSTNVGGAGGGCGVRLHGIYSGTLAASYPLYVGPGGAGTGAGSGGGAGSAGGSGRLSVAVKFQ